MSNTSLPSSPVGPTVSKVETIEAHAREIRRLSMLIAGISNDLNGDSPHARFFQLARLFAISAEVEMLALELKRLLLPGEVE